MAQLNAWITAEADLPDSPDLDPADLSTDPAPARLWTCAVPAKRVIDGDEPFAEDAWPTVRIGNLRFRTTMVCDRCVMSTIDPLTLAGGKEPIRTLARHRRWDRKTWQRRSAGARDRDRPSGVTPLAKAAVGPTRREPPIPRCHQGQRRSRSAAGVAALE